MSWSEEGEPKKGALWGEVGSARRSAGVLLPLFSLGSAGGIGDMGPASREAVDWLVAAGCSVWQVLPLGPVDRRGCPYSSFADAAGESRLISMEDLVEAGLLERCEISPLESPRLAVDYGAVGAWKEGLLKKAALRLLGEERHSWWPEFTTFVEESPWLDEVALFEVLRELHRGAPWWEWEQGVRARAPEALVEVRENNREAYDVRRVIQFFFAKQWAALRGYCAGRGVTLLGDLPIYVHGDSADVWAAQSLFELDAEGRPRVVSGVPPDEFAPEGQLWGHPVYRFDTMAEDDFSWWVRRFKRAFQRFDVVRIDHFRGFAAFWAVPAESSSAADGAWVPGPGTALFKALRDQLPEFPVVIEDLGVIDAPVVSLAEDLGAPGMRVLQFGYDSDPTCVHRLENHPWNSISYTGTHDTNTGLGWLSDLDDGDRASVLEELHIGEEEPGWGLVDRVMASKARLAMVPVSDLLGLGAEGRINVPGTTEGNWQWRLGPGQLSAALAARLRGVTERHQRARSGGENKWNESKEVNRS